MYHFFLHIFKFVFSKSYRASLKKQKKYKAIATDPNKTLVEKKVAMSRLTLEQILQNDEQKKNALVWAQFYERAFKGKWFTLKEAVRKTPGGSSEARIKDLLHLLTLFKVAIVRQSRIQTPPELRFKITINEEDRKRLLKEEAELLKNKAQAIERDIA